MGAVNTGSAIALVKARLNRLQTDTSLDVYLNARIDAAVQEIEGTGIKLEDNEEDLMLAVDYTVWQYQNRDNPGHMPEWLRLRRRERWLREGVKDDS